MATFKSHTEFDLYKKGLESRINQLEKELKDSPKVIKDALNPFKKTPETLSNDPIIGNAVRNITKAQIVPQVLKFKGLSTLSSLLPVGMRVFIKMVSNTTLPSNVLRSIINSTELTVEEERILADAELEDIKEQEQLAILKAVQD